MKVLVPVALLGCGVAVAAAALAVQRPAGLQGMAFFRPGGALLLVVAGVLSCVGWRVSGRALALHVGASFAASGLVALSIDPLQTAGTGEVSRAEAGIAVQTAIGLVAAVGLMRGLLSPPVDATLRLGRVLLGLTALGVVAGQALLRFLATTEPSLRYPWYLVSGGLALAWAVIGATYLHRSRRTDDGTALWVGITGVLFTVLAGFYTVVVATTEEWPAVGPALFLCAAGVPAVGSVLSTRAALHAQQAHARQLHEDLLSAQTRLATEVQEREHRLHDARGALAAVRFAEGTLRRYGERLDDGLRATLEQARASELARLERLVDDGEPS